MKNIRRTLIIFIGMLFALNIAYSKTTKPTRKNLALPAPVLPLDELPTVPRSELVNILGWHHDEKANNLCQGYYIEPYLNPEHKQIKAIKNSPTVIHSSHSELMPNGQSALIGNVVITQAGRKLTANQAYINRNAKQKEISSIDMYGNVKVREPGLLVVGGRAHLAFSDRSGSIDNVTYRSAPSSLASLPKDSQIIDNKELKISSLNQWGRAVRLQQIKPGLIKLYQATYTSCPPSSNTWAVKASRITLDKNSGTGTAINSRLYIKDIPVLYFPYFSFPIDKRRKSGFLFPSYGHNSTSGYNINVPYYWNMAPNYDMTITPNFLAKRGAQINDHFRYLTNRSKGATYISFLPDDRAFRDFRDDATIGKYPGRQADLNRLKNDSVNRTYLAWQNHTNLNSYFSSDVNANYVTDDYYFEDFDRVFSDQDIDQLTQTASLNFNSTHWTSNLTVLNYQTLHPIDQAVLSSPYSEIPSFDLDAAYPDQAGGLSYNVPASMVYFTHNKTPGEDADSIPTGERYNIRPGISLPLGGLGMYFTPRIQLDLTKDYIQHQTAPYNSNPSRVVPIFDIKTGMNFDRDFTVDHKAFSQTLEPELYYLLVPYENQNALPLFDTSEPILSVDQLLSDNRFSGLDRLGDANQLTLATRSRTISQATGKEIFSIGVAEAMYFRNRRVNLTPGQTDTNNLSDTTFLSPLVASSSLHLFNNWSLDGNITWDPRSTTPLGQSLNFHYQTDNYHIFNIGYDFSQKEQPFLVGGTEVNRTDQILGDEPKEGKASFIWPVPYAKNWALLGYDDYDIGHKRNLGLFAGLQYDSCCWSIRFFGGRNLNYLDNNNRPVYNTTYFVQFVLKGLGNLGYNDASGILSNINGFTDPYVQEAQVPSYVRQHV